MEGVPAFQEMVTEGAVPEFREEKMLKREKGQTAEVGET